LAEDQIVAYMQPNKDGDASRRRRHLPGNPRSSPQYKSPPVQSLPTTRVVVHASTKAARRVNFMRQVI
jgi:hypothetical protein